LRAVTGDDDDDDGDDKVQLQVTAALNQQNAQNCSSDINNATSQ